MAECLNLFYVRSKIVVNESGIDCFLFSLQAVLAARCSYFEAMFRSFMPEDNTVTVGKIQFIGDKNFFNELRVSLMTETDFSLNSVLHRIPTQQT